MTKPRVLFIDGLYNADFYFKQLTAIPEWSEFDITRVIVEFNMSTNSYTKADSLKHEILSRKYGVIVVCDLSHHPKAHRWFEKQLGKDLQDFVRDGGLVAFPTTEGGLLQSTLKKLFDTPWVRNDYFRTDWAIHPQLNRSVIASVFAGLNLACRFSAKCCTLRNVPSEDRVFVDANVSMVDQSEDDHVSVATRKYGKGRIAYFGDVNCEKTTAQLVLAFCRGAPKTTAANASPAGGSIENVKSEGNAHFVAGRYEEAIEYYDVALAAGRTLVSQLCSNKAEAFLRLRRNAEAESSARSALEFDNTNDKARFRLAKALQNQGGDERLSEAVDMLSAMNGTPSPEVVELKRVISNAKNGKIPVSQTTRTPATPQTPVLHNHELPGNASWVHGLNETMRYDWLVDCYRMRIDDSYVYSGDLRGVYDPDHKPASILRDFLVFVKLAAQREVIPKVGWSWEKFFAASKRLVMYAFEKSDAQDKYGEENVFAVLAGGRSLRYTAEIIYGPIGSETSEYRAMRSKVFDATRYMKFSDKSRDFFSDVGGWEEWRDLLAGLKR